MKEDIIRNRTITEEKLYQRYMTLGEYVKKIAKYHNQKIVWDMITQEGLWRIPVNLSHGGDGFTWKEYMAALAGLMAAYYDPILHYSLVSHTTAIYFLLTQGTKQQKSFLSRLANGENVSMFINESDIKTNVSLRTLAKGLKCPSEKIVDSNIIILITEVLPKNYENRVGFFVMDNDIEFKKEIYEQKFITIPNFLLDEKEHYQKNVIVSKNTGIEILNKLIDVENILHRMISPTQTIKFAKKYKKSACY